MVLHNKVILITGGARRIGRALVKEFAERNARVAFTYRSSKKEAHALKKNLLKKKKQVNCFRAQLGKISDTRRVLACIQRQWGPVEVLINCASDFYPTPFEKIKLKDWDHFIQVNLTGTFLFAWQAGLLMKKRGKGKIINIADWAAERPYKNYLPYTVSKTGVLGLTKSLAIELAPKVMVNAISPGPVLPAEGASLSVKKGLAQSVPLRKLGSPKDVVAAALFLVEQTDYMTGANIPVEGGRLIV